MCNFGRLRIHINLKMFVKRVLIGFLVFLAVIISSLFLLPPFLGKSKPVSSNLLVVEGWVSDNAMAQAADQIRSGNYSMIVTTGGPTPEDVEMLYNGYIVIKCANLPIQNFKEITVEAFGDKGGNENAHFKLLVDNRMVGETYVSKKLQPYKFNVPDGINRIDSVTVVFDNDYFVSKSDDRNLYIRSIVIGNKEISARSDRNYLVNNGVKTPVHSNFAKRAAFDLMKLGIDSSKIIAVPAIGVKSERTLTSARTFATWVYRHKIHVSNCNIFSQGIHSRRSWLEYRFILGKHINVGIIAAHDPAFEKKWWTSRENIHKVFREGIGCLYFRILLLSQIF